jgi:hypothetical protein
MKLSLLSLKIILSVDVSNQGLKPLKSAMLSKHIITKELKGGIIN